MKRKILILWLVINILLVLLSSAFFIGTWMNNKKINTADRAFFYSVQSDGSVRLDLNHGQTIDLYFSCDSAKIHDSYQIERREDILCIVLFVREYATEKGYAISRTNVQLYGELRLHNLLYDLGIEREHTADSDLDYMRDKRWYVNAAGNFIGWCGM